MVLFLLRSNECECRRRFEYSRFGLRVSLGIPAEENSQIRGVVWCTFVE